MRDRDDHRSTRRCRKPEFALVITILGWSTLIKGVLKIGFPELVRRQAQPFGKRQIASAVLLVALEGWLFWMSL